MLILSGIGYMCKIQASLYHQFLIIFICKFVIKNHHNGST